MHKNNPYEEELQNEILNKIKKKRESIPPLYKRIDYIWCLTFLLGMLALSLLLWIIMPVHLDYDHYFRQITCLFNLRPLYEYLPFFGVFIFFIMLFNKKRLNWLLIFSLFCILFPYYSPMLKYINKNYNTNIAEKLQDDRTPLLIAIKYNHIKKVEILLANNANPNEKFGFASTVIFIAILNENFEITKLLLEHGAKSNSFNYIYGTPLHVAVRKKNYKITELLLKYNASPNIQTKFNKIRMAFTSFRDFGKNSSSYCRNKQRL